MPNNGPGLVVLDLDRARPFLAGVVGPSQIARQDILRPLEPLKADDRCRGQPQAARVRCNPKQKRRPALAWLRPSSPSRASSWSRPPTGSERRDRIGLDTSDARHAKPDDTARQPSHLAADVDRAVPRSAAHSTGPNADHDGGADGPPARLFRVDHLPRRGAARGCAPGAAIPGGARSGWIDACVDRASTVDRQRRRPQRTAFRLSGIDGLRFSKPALGPVSKRQDQRQAPSGCRSCWTTPTHAEWLSEILVEQKILERKPPPSREKHPGCEARYTLGGSARAGRVGGI